MRLGLNWVSLDGVGWERKSEKAIYRQAFAARRHSTMHSTQPCRKALSPKRCSMAILNPKLQTLTLRQGPVQKT